MLILMKKIAKIMMVGKAWGVSYLLSPAAPSPINQLNPSILSIGKRRWQDTDPDRLNQLYRVMPQGESALCLYKLLTAPESKLPVPDRSYSVKPAGRKFAVGYIEFCSIPLIIQSAGKNTFNMVCCCICNFYCRFCFRSYG